MANHTCLLYTTVQLLLLIQSLSQCRAFVDIVLRQKQFATALQNLMSNPNQNSDTGTDAYLVDSSNSSNSNAQRLRNEANKLREKALALKDGLKSKATQDTTNIKTNVATTVVQMPWHVPDDDSAGISAQDGVDYRLYVDIGRKEGTWMDPRWGASGSRIELTLDVRFANKIDKYLVPTELAQKMVDDNIVNDKSPVYTVVTAPYARLRSGFDRMKCFGGAYRIDKSNSNKSNSYNTQTLRFFIETAGIAGPSYKDVSIPSGCLYFSLPIFNGSLSQLSTKQGPVTVRQIGWHTGWRRNESRIVGVFCAKDLASAKAKDKF